METRKIWVPAILGICAIAAAAVLGRSYTYKYRSQDRIAVTGLGEKEFVSDLIVWKGAVVEQAATVGSGYAALEENKRKVQAYLHEKGVADSTVLFMFVNVERLSESVYDNGHYVGERFTGYQLRQEFKIESTDVEAVENVSREISSLIARGVMVESEQPDYFYTRLSDLKQELIEQASADARTRAENIARNAGARLGRLSGARMGVFQITGANSNEALSAGGVYNSASKHKKASITVRLEYLVK